MKTLLLLLIVSSAHARDFNFSKTVNPDILQSELKAAGFQVYSINRIGTRQWVFMPDSETKDPSPVIAAHVYTDSDSSRDTVRAQAILLAKKLRASPGAMTPDERDSLLLKLCFLLLSQDQ